MRPEPQRGLTTADVAARYRVGEDTVRAWIRAGELAAVSTAPTHLGRPRFVVMPEALAAFEAARRAGPAPKAPRRRRGLKSHEYYPD